mgnify:CR=1 FL=1
MPHQSNRVKHLQAARAAKAAASRTGEEIAQGYIDSCQMEIDDPYEHNPQSDFVPSALTL